MRLSILGVIVAALVLNAIPAGASISIKVVRAQYLRDVAATNAVLFRFFTLAGKWSNQTSDATAEKEAGPGDYRPASPAERSLVPAMARQGQQ